MQQTSVINSHLLFIAKQRQAGEVSNTSKQFNWNGILEHAGVTEEEYLIKHYEHKKINDLAKEIGCHRNALMRRAKRLGLGSRHQYQREGSQYLEAEQNIIELLESGLCNECIAKKLNRSKEGIRKKIKRMSEDGMLVKTERKQCGCDKNKNFCRD